jgi:hypothetical protein
MRCRLVSLEVLERADISQSQPGKRGSDTIGGRR